MNLLNKKGFSLIEVLMVVGMLGGLSLAFMKLTDNNLKATKSYETRNDMIAFKAEITALLSDKVACFKSLGGKNPSDTATISFLQDNRGNQKYIIGNQMGTLKIIKFELSDDDATFDPKKEVARNATSGDTYLIAHFDRGKTALRRYSYQRIKLMITHDGVAIKTCSSNVVTTDVIWSRVETKPVDIFYEDGKVGIGTSTPVTQLTNSSTATITDGTYSVDASLGLNWIGWASNTYIAGLSNTKNNGGGLLIRSGDASVNNNISMPLHVMNNAPGNTLFTVRNDGDAYFSGNVGIGTATPPSSLTVQNSVTSDWNSVVNVLAPSANDGIHTAGVYFGRARTTDELGHFTFVPSATAKKSQIRMGIWSRNDLLNIEGTGHVGIGTVAPSQLLHVSKNDASLYLGTGIAAGVNAVMGDGHLVLAGEGDVAIIADSNGGTTPSGTITLGGGNTGVYSKSSASSTLWPSGLPPEANDKWMTIKNGKVGIGTTTPDAKLDINGTRNSTVSTTTAVLKSGGGDVHLYSNAMSGSPWGVWMQVLNNAGSSFPLVLNPSGGKVGIGKNPSYLLDVDGWIGAKAVYYPSDIRLKKNIKKLNGLDFIQNLEGVSFNWKKDNKKSIGVIAQEVEKKYPYLVSTSKESGKKSVDYAVMVAPLIEAVKELQRLSKNQELKIKILEKKIEKMAE